MKNIVIWTLLLGCVGYIASEGYKDAAPMVANYIHTDTLAEQRELPQFVCGKQVVNLPNDQGKFYTTVFLPANGQSKALGWFQTDSRLKDLKGKTHWNTYEADSPFYSRYKKYHGNSGKTVVLVQDPYGREIYCSSRKGLPNSGSNLASAIQSDITANCIFRRWRDRRNPEPEPSPEPDDESDEEVVDEETVEPEPEATDDFPFLLVALGLVVGLGMGVGTSYYEQYYKPEA